MKWITAADLEAWAGTVIGRYQLSELISALVRATARDITEFRFPTGDSAQLPGYDGVLEAKGGPVYLPNGVSVWEFGTGEDPQEKATDDYRKRTAKPGSVVPAQTTFVFVTPRPWPNRDKWIRFRLASGRKKWADVRVIDGVDLEAWLEDHPGVAASLATQTLKKLPVGVASIEGFWEEYSSRTNPSLTEHVILAGREQEAEKVRQALGGSPVGLVVRADSPEEALAFVIAAIRTAADDARKFVSSRTLVAADDAIARQLSTFSGLTIGIQQNAASVSGLLVQKGNFVVVPLGSDAPNHQNALVLARPPGHVFAKALETMGRSAEDAERLARECGRSVTVLQRRVPAVTFQSPPWRDSSDHRSVLIPALLAGSWDAKSEGDRAAIEVLSRTTYADFESRLTVLLNIPDSPVERIGSVWRMVAPVDGFELLAPYIAPRDIDALREVCIEVFGELDPSLDLPADERPYAALHGKTLKHSSWLRDGLAGTVLLTAVRGKFAGLRCPGDCQQFANHLVATLPGLADDHRLLASLHDQLPLLMEAAPGPLVEALERLLEGDGQQILGIFSEAGLLGSSSPHTGLLWALERLAWDPGYVESVSLILARLARVDPGGKLANRPIRSLRGIFLTWHPSTNASLKARLRVLDRVLREEPEVGWRLLLSLFPKSFDHGEVESKPKWRDAGASEKEVLTDELVLDSVSEVVSRALRHADDDASRWTAIIEEMHDFPPRDRVRVYEQLQVYTAGLTLPVDREAIWSALVEAVNRHTKFASADWALPRAEVEQLERLAAALKPDDLIILNRWLFDEYHPDIPDSNTSGRHDAADEPRRAAVAAIFRARGIDGVLELARQVKLPHLVGVATAGALNDLDVLGDLLEAASAGTDAALQPFSVALSGTAEFRYGHTWRAHVLSLANQRNWSVDRLVAVIVRWSEPETWNIVSGLGADVERLYWSTKPIWPNTDSSDAMILAANKYLEVERASAALEAFGERVARSAPELALRLIDAALDEINKGTRPPDTFAYELEQTLEALAERDDVAEVDVARREYAFLPLLARTNSDLVLHRLLLREPELYMQILVDVYRPASQSADSEQPDDQKASRAKLGYRLLHSLRKIPGLDENGVVDETSLSNWVHRVRTLAVEHDRSKVSDHAIGRLLAYAPSDPIDHAWPNRAVRNLLEEIQAPEVERGIQLEQVNKRGAHWRDPYAGGAQERQLAAEVRGWARTCADWPRIARVLIGIAEMWERYAKDEDERAEQDKARE